MRVIIILLFTVFNAAAQECVKSFGQAEDLWMDDKNEKALEVIDKVFKTCKPSGADSDTIVFDLSLLKGKILAEMEKYKESVQAFTAAETIGGRQGRWIPRKMELFDEHLDALTALKDYGGAQTYLDKGLALAKEAGLATEAFYASFLKSAGDLESSRENYEQAKVYYSSSFQIYEKRKDAYGYYALDGLAEVALDLEEFVFADSIFKIQNKWLEEYCSNKIADKELCADRYYLLGFNLYNADKYREALDALSKSEALYAPLKQTKDVAESVIELKTAIADVYQKTGDIAKANAKFAEAEKLASDLTDKSYLGSLYYRKAEQFIKQKDYDRAKESAEKSKSLYEKIDPDGADVAYALGQMARISKLRNDRVEEESLRLQYKDRMKRIHGQTDSYAVACNLLGTLYQETGQYLKAKTEFLEALSVYYKINQKGQSYAGAMESLAGLYRTMDRYQSADSLYNLSMEVYQNNKELGDRYAILLYQKGFTQQLKGDYTKAIDLLTQARSLFKKKSGKNDWYSYCETQIGEVYYAAGDYNKAYPFFERSISLSDSLKLYGPYAGRLRKMGFLMNYRGKTKEGLALIRKMIHRAGIDKIDPINVAIAYQDMATIYRLTNLNDSALIYSRKAANLYRSLKGELSNEFANNLTNIAWANYNLGRTDSTDYLLSKRLEIFRNTNPRSKSYTTALFDLAGFYLNVDRHGEAEVAYKESIRLERELTGPTISLADKIRLLGWYYYQLANYADAMKCYQEAKTMVESLAGTESVPYASILLTEGPLHAVQGHFTKAEEMYMQARAIEISKRGKTPLGYATSLNNLASLYSSMGLYDKASAYYLEVIATEKLFSGTNSASYAFYLNNYARVNSAMKNYARADSCYAQVRRIRKALFGINHPLTYASLYDKANLDRTVGNYTRAISAYDSVITYRKKVFGVEHINTLQVLRDREIAMAGAGERRNTEGAVVRLMAAYERLYGANHPSFGGENLYMAQFNVVAKKFAQAKPYFKKVLDVRYFQIEKLFPSMTEKQREDFYASIKNDFNIFNSYALIQSGKVDFLGRKNSPADPAILQDLFNNQVATKGLLLNNAAKIRKLILSGSDKVLQAKYQEWEKLKAQLAALYQKTPNASDPVIAMSTEATKDSLEQKILVLEKELAKKSNRFAKATDNAKPTWKEIRAGLKVGEGVIEMIRMQKYGIREFVTDHTSPKKQINPRYALTDTILYVAMIITPETVSGPEVVVLGEGNLMEDRYLKEYQGGIYLRRPDLNSYDRYWRKIFEHKAIKGKTKTIYFSADGVYNQISLNALLNPQTKKYVIDEVNVQLVTNSKDILSAKTAGDENYYGLFIGNPSFYAAKKAQPAKEGTRSFSLVRGGALTSLPGAEKEVGAIKNLIDSLQQDKWEVVVHKGSSATEEKLKNLEKPKVLHIATHGFFQQSQSVEGTRGVDVEVAMEESKKEQGIRLDPMVSSGLFLSGGGDALADLKTFDYQLLNRDDGIFTAYEAMNLNIEGTELVVLSACETGLGEVNNGEGVYGLQRALKVAGADAIVMSLWSVSDESTMILMREFYKQWISTGDKLESFRRAQLAVRAHSQFDHPFFWSAFVMVGD